MGFDVSYHPISENEMREWYFNRLEEVRLNDMEYIRSLTQQFNMDEQCVKKYIHTLKTGADADSDLTVSFDKTHGFFVAVVQGFFRTYFYLRGSMLTSVIEKNPEFEQYSKPWKDILQTDISRPVANKITENYCSGVFLPHEQVKRLYNDYTTIPLTKNMLDEEFCNGQIEVLLKAIRFCVDNKVGLLEATEVIEPNPLDLNQSESYSNLYNCDTQGPLMYQHTALTQITQATASMAEGEENPVQKSRNRGFFAKLFKK